MIENSSENLIFEIVSKLTENNIYANKDQLFNTLSNIVVKYEITKLDDNDSTCNLPYYIEQFLSAKQLDGLSRKTTLKTYKLQLEIFTKDIFKNVEQISTAHIRNFLSKYTHLKASSIASKISILKSFFGWLLQEEIIQKDPTKKIKTPKFNKKNPKYLDVDELEMLRDSCKTLRQRALVEVLYATGCRLSEVHDMKIEDINFTNFSTKVVGKGNKEREVYFSLKAIYHLKKYLKSRDDDCEALFVTERKEHKRLSRRAIQREIRLIADNSPIKKNVTVHSLRHTFASLTLNNGAELSVVQSLLGHSSADVTQIYAHLTDERKREQYKKHLVL